jgi:hypothetical protein
LKEKSKKKELGGMVLKEKKRRKRGEGRTSFFAILRPKIHG